MRANASKGDEGRPHGNPTRGWEVTGTDGRGREVLERAITDSLRKPRSLAIAQKGTFNPKVEGSIPSGPTEK